MRIFLNLLKQGIRNFSRNRMAHVLTISAVTFVSFLAGIFALVLYNFHEIARDTQDRVQFQVYWAKDHPLEEVQRQWEDISTWDIESIKSFTPDQALEVLVNSISEDLDPQHLAGSNPLPPTAEVEFSLKDEQGRDRAQEMLSRLEKLPGVDKVSYNPLQLDMAGTWLKVTSRIVWPLIFIMLFITGLVVANTLKLNQLHRRDEVEILSLVGASPSYIRFPLVLTGAVHGLAGGILAMVLLKAAQMAVRNVLYFAPLWIRIDFLPAWHAAAIPAVLAGVGILSGLMAGKVQN
ncbi:MAG: cell division protein FtsX [Desulfonatronovibrionaceae bacterium]